MELDITDFFNNAAPADYSASAMELGDNAGRITWGHAVEDAPDYPLLDTDDKREAFRDFIREFGAWDNTEIAAWTDQELTALLIQFISGDMREANLDPAAPDWTQYEKDAEAGRVSSRIFRSANRVYFYIGN